MILQTVSEWYTSTRLLGLLVIFGVVGIPVYLPILTSVFEPPRRLSLTVVFISMIGVLVLGFIALFAVLGGILSLLVP